MLKIPLHPLHLSNFQEGPFFVSCVIKDEVTSLSIHFQVKGRAPFYVKKEFSDDFSKNWGMWESDVVECFIGKSKEAPYLEIQVNPRGKLFLLHVEKPREEFFFPEKQLCEVQATIINEREWKASITLSKEDIPGKANEICLNLFACLGQAHQRSHFAMNPNLEEKIDFHRPQYFLPLSMLLEEAN